jgi:NADH-quinone oxidoreductase subunit J
VLGPWNFGLDVIAKPEPLPAGYSNTGVLGLDLYTVYVYQFEIAAVILLVAIIAAIRLTLRRRPDTKFLDPGEQVKIKKGSDRIRVVSMPAEVTPRPVTNPSGAAGAEKEAAS